jgi:hypothetical protein
VNFQQFNLTGELTEKALLEKDDKFMDPDEAEETMEDEDEEFVPPSNKSKKSADASDNGQINAEKSINSPVKATSEIPKNKCEFEQTIINTTLLKPDISELPKQSSKETLSYLKAKRIVRHKNISANNDGGPEAKKIKSTDATSAT